jgi:hypothetical protein
MMYHATPERNLRSILREGLVPQVLPKHVQDATGLRRGVYLDTSETAALGDWASLSLRDIPEDADTFSEVYAVLEVRVADSAVLIPDPEVSSVGGEVTSFIYGGCIPPRSVKDTGVRSEIEWG